MSVIREIEQGNYTVEVIFEDSMGDQHVDYVATDKLLALAKQGEKMRWIPVNERLPEDGQFVDIWVPPYIGRITNSVYKKDMYCFTDSRSGCGKYIIKDDVSHWKLLPEPPREV